jgi:tyrosyl-tRNA synthetase
MPLLEGLDGVEKMSKSLGNYVGVTEPPAEMFGKLMSITDELMFRYYELLTDMSLSEIETLRVKMKKGDVHPMQVKMDLARRIVTDFHSGAEAERAEEAFRQVFSQRKLPDEMPEHHLKTTDGSIRLTQLMLDAGTVSSKGEANRLIRQKAVAIDEAKVEADREIDLNAPGSFVLRVGKRRFVRVRME